MSRSFKVITTKKIDWQEFLISLRSNDDDVLLINRHPTYYFYQNLLSARGVDVTEVEYGLDIRTTTCSNDADYLLANRIASTLKDETGGAFFDEAHSEIFTGNLFSKSDIAKYTYEDIETLKSVLSIPKSISLIGPNRPFHIDRIFRKKIMELDGDPHAMAFQFSKMMLQCQYPSDEFEELSNLMQVSGKDDTKVLVQNYFNSKSMILENVDTVIFGLNDVALYIKPKHLVQFLPASWQLLDDFTIAARQLPEAEWEQYFESMRPFNGGVKTIGKK